MRPGDSDNAWIEDNDGNAESFVGLFQLFSEKMVTMLKSMTLVAYSVHATILNVSTKRWQWLVNNEHTMVVFLPVCRTQHQLECEDSVENE